MDELTERIEGGLDVKFVYTVGRRCDGATRVASVCARLLRLPAGIVNPPFHACHPPGVFYLGRQIPVFHNPTGVTMSAARRESLVALSKKHKLVVIADEV